MESGFAWWVYLYMYVVTVCVYDCVGRDGAPVPAHNSTWRCKLWKKRNKSNKENREKAPGDDVKKLEQ